MRIKLLIPALFLILTAFAVCVRAQDVQPEYRLGGGDVIKIIVFQNADLTLETRVSENGTITFPLIGTVRLGGMTISGAETTIATALRSGGFIQQPQVNVILLQNRGNQVSVLGQVARPGRFPLDTVNIRLSEILATAGGIAAEGADVVIVTGTRNGKPFRREVDIAGMFISDRRVQEDLLVEAGDVLFVQRQPKFYVYGEVKQTGSYRVERNMTIRQALAQSGGPTPRGTEKNLAVFRSNAKGVVDRITPDLNDPVLPGDVIYVRESLF